MLGIAICRLLGISSLGLLDCWDFFNFQNMSACFGNCWRIKMQYFGQIKCRYKRPVLWVKSCQILDLLLGIAILGIPSKTNSAVAVNCWVIFYQCNAIHYLLALVEYIPRSGCLCNILGESEKSVPLQIVGSQTFLSFMCSEHKQVKVAHQFVKTLNGQSEKLFVIDKTIIIERLRTCGKTQCNSMYL